MTTKTLKDCLLEGGVKGRKFKDNVKYTNAKEGREYVFQDLVSDRELGGRDLIAQIKMKYTDENTVWYVGLATHYNDTLVE